MAISPTVQQYQQQQIQPQQALSSQQAFEQKFGDAAYNTFRAKYPKLLEFVVTFKMINADLDAGSAIGTFILAHGPDVLYVPAVMANGAIESCEMVYNKADDSFMPLTDDTVKKIVNTNSLTDYSLAKGHPHIQTTDELFKRFVRPPASSNPLLGGAAGTVSSVPHQVLAGSRQGVALLPNSVKEKIAGYFQDHPDLLGEVAGFYPVEALAEKLAAVPEPVDAVPDLPTVVSIDALTAKLAADLSREQKAAALADGYVILKQAEDSPDVVSTKHLARDLIGALSLSEIQPSDDAPVGTGYVFFLDGTDLVGEKCLIAGTRVFTRQGSYSASSCRPLVIAGFDEGITAADLLEFGAQAPGALNTAPQDPDAKDPRFLHVFYPMKNRRYRRYTKAGSDCGRPSDFDKNLIDGRVHLKSRFGQQLGFVSTIPAGCIELKPSGALFPEDALVLSVPDARNVYIDSLEQLFRLISAATPRVKLVADGAGTTLVDSTSQKTASFRSKPELVAHLVDAYGFSKQAVDTLLADKEVLVLKKQAFVRPSDVETSGSDEQLQDTLYAGAQAAPQVSDQPAFADFDPDVLEASAALQDPELLDTGMLASVAGDESIKSVLVDMLPEFSTTVTRLGQAILMLVLNKDDLEDFYGREDYQDLLGNVRKVFKTLGMIVADLQLYVNMQ